VAAAYLPTGDCCSKKPLPAAARFKKELFGLRTLFFEKTSCMRPAALRILRPTNEGEEEKDVRNQGWKPDHWLPRHKLPL